MNKNNFYKNAWAYDIAFNDREYDTECNFIEWCFDNYNRVKYHPKQKLFLEVASGPARHAREFAKRNWKSVALDLSEEMLHYAEDEAKKENLNLEFIQADMSNFNLRKPVHLTVNLMESIAHLTTNEQMISHFQSVARNLVSGGIYIIEATHPMFFFPDDETNTWSYKAKGKKVEVTFGLPTDKYNSVTQEWNVTSRIKINENGKNYVWESVSPVRWYLAQEMKALIELSGAFDKYWMFGSLYYTPPSPLDDTEDSDAMVIVLRKK
ncbi:MAG: class I SAM-dependent methyltransferase [Melioribacteraceae bacterium]|nr:class I SAM-dependent methyltransferase [Melioribacteraceae bacterium]MCF8353879.1 class I SAM-dependent methyltransferase [Melioribacteraceae bacterium]MCF8393112.1 class I SAM-dependent methyltransferase [Melioribacteraceae bacterium]MCF8419231.1 class I SAM-dependent methyltransferase [Melioribacteraceae bacterium]